jgi:queuine/archaeosine tRNA-ribosyltransferase
MLLEKVNKLGDSLTREQVAKLQKALGGDIFAIFDNALDSKNEEEASERVKLFIDTVKKSPIKMIKARKLLNKEQKSIIIELLENNDEIE